MIRIVFGTTYSKSELCQYPSNYGYYIKDFIKDPDFDVMLINPKDYKGNYIQRMMEMVKVIRDFQADILYLNLWQGFNNLVFAKILGLLKCKIVIWKYTYCIDSSNPFKHFFYKKIYWNAIDRIYMMFDNHTDDALRKNLIKSSRITTLSRGTDISWYSEFVQERPYELPFSLIATGQDHRDYATLAKACEETHTKCLIIGGKYSNTLQTAEEYKDSIYVRFEFLENPWGIDAYRYIMKKVGEASALAICCEKLPYGAGYTNIVDSLAFKIPIIQTLNPDVHLDPQKEGIGYSVMPYDVEGWKRIISDIKDNVSKRIICAEKIQNLLNEYYNSQYTAAYIKRDFFNLLSVENG